MIKNHIAKFLLILILLFTSCIPSFDNPIIIGKWDLTIRHSKDHNHKIDWWKCEYRFSRLEFKRNSYVYIPFRGDTIGVDKYKFALQDNKLKIDFNQNNESKEIIKLTKDTLLLLGINRCADTLTYLRRNNFDLQSSNGS